MKDQYPLWITLPVLWGHMDAFQHVNNVIYFRYLESARIEYFEKAGLTKIMVDTGVGPILAEAKCKYIRPLRYPDTIEVGCRTVIIRSSEMEQEYVIYSQKQKEIVTTGWALIVAYDYKNLKRATFDKNFIDKLAVFDPKVEIKL